MLASTRVEASAGEKVSTPTLLVRRDPPAGAAETFRPARVSEEQMADAHADRPPGDHSMNRQPLLIRILGTAGVGVFLVASVAFGPDAIGQTPGRSIDTTLTSSDDSAGPGVNQLAEPTET